VLKFHLNEIKANTKASKDNSKSNSNHFFDNLINFCFNTILMASRTTHRRERADSLEKGRRGLVVDGKSLSFVLERECVNSFVELSEYCSSVLCCRATPLQKASVVTNVKEKLNVMTLAIGKYLD